MRQPVFIRKETFLMNLKQAVEKNRPYLEIYCTLSRLMGWVLLVSGGVLFFINGLQLASQIDQMIGTGHLTKFDAALVTIPLQRMIQPGLLILLVAHLLRYILGKSAEPGWFLSAGKTILYLLSTTILFDLVPAGWYLQDLWSGKDHSLILAFLFGGTYPNLLIVIAKMTAFIGLAQALRRVLPMIEEAKSLV
jgi:hypothetical protein